MVAQSWWWRHWTRSIVYSVSWGKETEWCQWRCCAVFLACWLGTCFVPCSSISVLSFVPFLLTVFLLLALNKQIPRVNKISLYELLRRRVNTISFKRKVYFYRIYLLLEGGAYLKVREMNNSKHQNLVIFFFQNENET